MLQTIEVMVEPNGNIRFLENLEIAKPTKALLTLLETPLNKVNISKRGSGEAILKFLHQNSLNSETFQLAAKLRAQHGLKTPDALHLATAIQNECGQFWTNDDRLNTAAGERAVNLFE